MERAFLPTCSLMVEKTVVGLQEHLANDVYGQIRQIS